MNEIKPIEWENHVVITTALLAEAYGTDHNNIKNNFKNHKNNFIEGKHYFLLQGEELKEFKNLVNNIDLVDKRTPQLYLWTERGANRHCKILDTDKAWEQFDNLEETYFNVKQSTIELDQLDPQTKLLNMLVQAISKNELEQKRQAERLKHVEEKQKIIIDTFKDTNDDNTEHFQQWTNSCITKIAESPCFNSLSQKQNKYNSYQLARQESYKRLKQKRNCRLEDRVQNAIGRAVKERPDINKSQLQKINKIYVIAHDKDLKAAYESVIREMMMCYCTN